MSLTTIGTSAHGLPGASGDATGLVSPISASNSEEYQGNAKAKNASGDIVAAYLHKAIGTVEVEGYASAYEAPALGGTATANGKTGTIVNASFSANSGDFAKAKVTGKYIVSTSI